MADDTPDLEAVGSLSENLFKNLIPDPELNTTQKEDHELDDLQYDALEHLAGYICHKIKDQDMSESA